MIRWITGYLGTAGWESVAPSSEFHRVDVRDLLDGPGNAPAVVRAKIEEALSHLRKNQKVVVCCERGMSRSNAVAAGILAAHQGVSVQEAIQRVRAATGETAIRIEVLAAVQNAVGGELRNARQPEVAERRLLLTGATGLIGAAVADELRLRHKVFAPTRQEINLARDAIGLDLLAKEQGVDTILHLAHPRVYTTNESLGEALVMLKNVLDVCADNGVFLIYLSGWQIYSGYKGEELKADESLPPNPGDTYGHAKLLCETLLEQYRRCHGLEYTLLRSSPVYGGDPDRPRFIGNFLRKALRNEPIVAHKFVNGFPKLDLLHRDDLRLAITAAVERRPKETLHLGTGVATSTTDIARRIVERTNSQSEIRHIELDGYASNIVMDSARARDVLEWSPMIRLNEGLETIIEWMRSKN